MASTPRDTAALPSRLHLDRLAVEGEPYGSGAVNTGNSFGQFLRFHFPGFVDEPAFVACVLEGVRLGCAGFGGPAGDWTPTPAGVAVARDGLLAPPPAPVAEEEDLEYVSTDEEPVPLVGAAAAAPGGSRRRWAPKSQARGNEALPAKRRRP
jgi:hypothetical protein